MGWARPFRPSKWTKKQKRGPGFASRGAVNQFPHRDTRQGRRLRPARIQPRFQSRGTTLGLLLLIVIILLLVGGLPTWPHLRNWGYGPSGVLGLILIILLVLVLMGQIPRGF
jgi:hypothetical protein